AELHGHRRTRERRPFGIKKKPAWTPAPVALSPRTLPSAPWQRAGSSMDKGAAPLPTFAGHGLAAARSSITLDGASGRRGLRGREAEGVLGIAGVHGDLMPLTGHHIHSAAIRVIYSMWTARAPRFRVKIVVSDTCLPHIVGSAHGVPEARAR